MTTTDVEALRAEIQGLAPAKQMRRYTAELQARVTAYARGPIESGLSVPAVCAHSGHRDHPVRAIMIAERERELVVTEAKSVNLYIDDWTALAHAMNEWYRPDELKKKMITDAANEIKRNAIEPALSLFAERLNEVRSFADRLHSISI